MAFYIATYNTDYQQKLSEALEDYTVYYMSSEQELLDILQNNHTFIEKSILLQNEFIVIFVDYDMFIQLKLSQQMSFNESITVTLVLLYENIEEINLEDIYMSKTTLIYPLKRFSASEMKLFIQLQIHNMKNMERLQHDACLDDLTQVKNRRCLMKFLEQSFCDYMQNRTPFCLAYLDLDHFKVINDTFGHVKGDELLIQISRVMVRNCRKTDMIGRIGGEEFAIVFPNTSMQQANDIIERIRSFIAVTDEIDDAVRVTLSGGLVESSFHHESYLDLVKEADLLLYKAKDWGRNQICQ